VNKLIATNILREIRIFKVSKGYTEAYLQLQKEVLIKSFEQLRIHPSDYDIVHRIKSDQSIEQKMKHLKCSVSEIYDIAAWRVIFANQNHIFSIIKNMVELFEIHPLTYAEYGQENKNFASLRAHVVKGSQLHCLFELNRYRFRINNNGFQSVYITITEQQEKLGIPLNAGEIQLSTRRWDKASKNGEATWIKYKIRRYGYGVRG
jgi:(p)ppGpp synthase/HD superfamily hydrolase